MEVLQEFQTKKLNPDGSFPAQPGSLVRLQVGLIHSIRYSEQWFRRSRLIIVFDLLIINRSSKPIEFELIAIDDKCLVGSKDAPRGTSLIVQELEAKTIKLEYSVNATFIESPFMKLTHKIRGEKAFCEGGNYSSVSIINSSQK